MPTLGELFTQVINQRVTTTAMADAIANINSMEIHVCTAGEYNSTTLIPTVATPDVSTFYLVPDGSGNNLYTEWIYVNNTWELFGRATIDLSGYATKANPAFTGSISLNRFPTYYGQGIGTDSIACGNWSYATGNSSAAFGNISSATARCAFAEGDGSQAKGEASHAEGSHTIAGSVAQHSGGRYNIEQMTATPTTWVEHNSYTTGDIVTYEGKLYKYTETPIEEYSFDMRVPGQSGYWYEIKSFAEIVGNGTANDARSNARALDWSGNEYLAGDLYVHANNDSTGGNKVLTAADLPDIRVGGNSVVNNGIANVPYATADTPGVVKVAYYNGIAVDNEYKRLYINKADDALIKAGTSDVRPIVPSNQHQSVFFGLSKLAGVNLAGQTVTVGTYPATSKAAIRNLIGAIATDDLDIQVTADTPVTITFGSATINDDNNVPSATMNATAFEEGLATLVIGTDEIPVHMALTTDNETGKTYYMTTETLQDGTTPVFAAQYTGAAGESTTVSYMAYSDETYAEAQTIALKYPRQKLTAQVPKMYLGCANDGSSGYMVATTDYLETNYAPKNNPVFTGMISLGRNTIYGSGANSIAVGDSVLAQALCSAAFGIFSQASNKYSFAANRGAYASGESAAAFGFKTRANGEASFAQGFWTYAGGRYSHVEGVGLGENNLASTKYGAIGHCSHAEGYRTVAKGDTSHAQGYYTRANYTYQTALGMNNVSDTYLTYPHWEANHSYAVGDRVMYDYDDGLSNDPTDYGIYICRVANNDAEWDEEKWYEWGWSLGHFAEIVGNGMDSMSEDPNITEFRSNARALDWDGNERLMGDVYVGCNADSSGGTKLARIPDPPSTNGTYTLQATVSNGTIVYTWVTAPETTYNTNSGELELTI